MSRYAFQRCGLALVLASLLGSVARAEPVVIDATPITAFSRVDPAQTRFGALSFRGGLVLRSAATGFGGFSGLRVDADGVGFHAVSDRAHWLTGRFAYDGTRVTGIEGADLTPVLGADGRSLTGGRDDDTEGLEIAGNRTWISTEGSDTVLRFEEAKTGLPARRGSSIAMPKEVSGLPGNTGLEAIALVPEGGVEAGRLLLVSEEAFGKDSHHAGWLVPADGTGPFASFSVTMRDGFAITDATFLPGGDLVLLERRFRPPFSLAVGLRRIPGADIRAGAVLDGTVLMEASLSEDIDNLEGISAHRAADGTTVLTLVSDDNFNPLQRTVLLQFGLAEP